MTSSDPVRPGRPCAICMTYARQRGARILAEIRRTTPTGQRLDRWAAFMAGVHRRHLELARAGRHQTTSTHLGTQENR